MRLATKFVPLLLAAGLVGCGAHPKLQATRPAASAPTVRPSRPAPRYETARVREQAPLPTRPILFETLSGTTEAAGPIGYRTSPEAIEVSVPIGSSEALHCVVYRTDRDPGGTVTAVLSGVGAKADVRSLQTTEVALAGEYPAVLLRLVYRSKGAERNALGELKLLFYHRPGAPVLCVHDEVGFHATFRRVALGLASSLAFAGGARPKPRYAEVRLDRIGAAPIGFVRREVAEGPKGTTIATTTHCSLVPKSSRELDIEDNVTIEHSDRDGRVVELSYAKTRNGHVELETALERSGAGAYAYRGVRNGKPFAGRFKTKDRRGLMAESSIGHELRRTLLGERAQRLELEEYHPAFKIDGPVEVQYLLSAHEAKHLTFALGPLRVQAETDDNGVFQKLEMPLGPLVVTEQRLLSQGTP